MKTKVKTSLLIGLAVVLVALVFLAVRGFFIEPNRLLIHEETITLRNWPASLSGLKIAAISDIHAGSPFIDVNKLRLIVQETNQQNPDMVLLLGDFMVQTSWHSRSIEPQVIADALKPLRGRLGVYAVLGNHDWWYSGEKVRQALESVGIRVLENDVARIQKDKETFWLVGLADAWTGFQNIEGTLRKVPSGELIIALTHNPDIFPEIPPNVELTLAGHTHGGQVELPLIGRRMVPSDYGQRYAAGHVEEGGKHLFVTTGIGTSIFPVRFRVPPEIAVLTLRSTR